MKLPKNGRIIIVDDKKDEAMPLIQTLSNNKYPVIYFDADPKNLPDEPLTGIRILFLDMNLLNDGDITPMESIISSTIGVLDKMIDSEKNGPIIIILWSRNFVYVEDMKKHLSEEFTHLKILSWDKSDFISNENYDLVKIEKRIEAEIDGMKSIELFLEWEDLIHKSTTKIVNDISEFYDYDDDWDSNMRAVFRKLAESYKGSKDESSFSKIFKDSMFSLNSILSDDINKQTLKTKLGNLDDDNSSDENLENNLVNAKINTKLLISKREKYFPGNIYENLEIKSPTAEDVSCNGTVSEEQRGELKPIFLEITPMCDYAQNKIKQYRILPGFLYSHNCNIKIKKAEYIYKLEKIYLPNQIYGLVFDFRYFTSIDIDGLEDSKIKFGIQSGQLADIQSRLASHISRIGTISIAVNDKK